jgi:Acyl-CoA dehydrogenase, C-terminal domain
MTLLTASLVDRAKSDFRLESAICKMLASEWAWKIANDTMQIRGGRGYETAASLARRGESPDPVERIVRDSRINTIFEGSSEIMRLFIAREALDPHLKISAPVLDRRLSVSLRGAAGLRAARFYGQWYPSTFLPKSCAKTFDPRLAGHVQWCASTARTLARKMFHQMVVYGPSLEKRQLLLARFVDAGSELFAMSSTLARVQSMIECADPDAPSALDVADYFCRSSQLRIAEWFRAVRRNTDDAGYRLARKLLANLPETLSEGILRKSGNQSRPDPSLDALQ